MERRVTKRFTKRIVGKGKGITESKDEEVR